MPPSKRQEIVFGGHRLVLDPCGAIYWPAEEMLIVSDLHLEKASFLAQFGSLLPQYDSLDTLKRLQETIREYDPRHLVCLGDSFHDRRALERLPQEETALLLELIAGRPNWHWILGNHDKEFPDSIPGLSQPQLHLHGLVMTHEPDAVAPRQIIGHFHPKLRMSLGGHKVRGKCFLHAPHMLIMPAFGSYTGGLDCDDPAIAGLSPQPFARYLMYRQHIWKIPPQ